MRAVVSVVDPTGQGSTHILGMQLFLLKFKLCSCFAVDFILKKLSIFASCFIVNGARPSGPAKYYHQSELSVLITSQFRIKLLPEWKVRRLEGGSAERPLFETCVIGRDMIYVASVFKTCEAAVRISPAGKTSQDFPSSALFSCHEVWFAHVRSVVNNISKSAMHKLVCIIATLLGIKLLQTPINSSILWHDVTISTLHSTSLADEPWNGEQDIAGAPNHY